MPTNTAAFFDLERTITRNGVELVMARAFWKQGQARFTDVARVSWVYARYLAGIEDFVRVKVASGKLMAGRRYDDDLEMARVLASERFEAQIFPQAYERINALQADGVNCVIVSATYRFLVEPFAHHLQIDDYTGQELEIVDGICTGELVEPVYRGDAKARYVHTYAETHDVDLKESWAFGDSMNDVPMLEAVGKPVVVNPGRKLHKLATARGWQIARWR